MPPPTPPGSTEIVRNRFLGFLIWQSVQSTAIFILTKAILLSPLTNTPLTLTLLSLLSFNLSLLLFSAALSAVSSPEPDTPATTIQLALRLLRLVFLSAGSQPSDSRRVRVSVRIGTFVVAAAVSGFVSVVSLCGGVDFDGLRLIGLGFRGFVLGLFYGIYYVYNRRWALEFPIIQRPPFFSFKMGLPSAFQQALKLSGIAYVLSAFLVVFLPRYFKSHATMGKFIVEQIIFYIGSFTVFLSWEISHHLHQVLHTKRFTFAPPKGSAAAETNPSEPLFAALEESTPRSLLRYLVHLDLCMVCESNVDTWRRAAFFEESGETYKRVVALCLRPLEHLALTLCECLEGSADKAGQLSQQLKSPNDSRVDLMLHEPFNDFQLCGWSSRTVASLTAHSHKEDRFGVAQLSSSNAAVLSTLLSCLLAVETIMGKKTNLQSSQLMGPAGIKWATPNSGRRDVPTGKKRSGLLHSKAYAMADVLRTCVYCIVSTFHDQMLTSAKAGLLDRDWIVSSKPLYGSRELLLHKLQQFLDFRGS